MTQYLVYDESSKESETFYSVSPAKRWMKERMKQGHEVSGSKTKIYSNGDWVPCGKIRLTGSNKVYVANTKAKRANY